MVIKSAFIANHLLVLGPEKYRDDERNMIMTMDWYVYEGLHNLQLTVLLWVIDQQDYSLKV